MFSKLGEKKMEGRIEKVKLDRDVYTVAVTYRCDDLVVTKRCGYTQFRWQNKATSMGERVAYATAEATKMCIEEMALNIM